MHGRTPPDAEPAEPAEPESARRGALGRAWRTFASAMEPAVFLPSATLVIGFVVFGGAATDIAAQTFDALRAFVLDTFGWLYVVGTSSILVVVVGLLVAVGGRGDLRLGRDDERPEFSRGAWFAMLFSAGMGTGLVYWGVAEPVHHALVQAPGVPLPGGSTASVDDREALALAFFHWGLHPWAVYTLFGLAIAYFHFRRGLPLAPRSMLHPLLGDRIFGWPGHLVDVVATVGTLFGVATSLGFGAQQVNAGLTLIADVPPADLGVQLALIATMTAIATLSVVLGISGGIRRLSSFNMMLAGAMLVFVIAVGPTLRLPGLLSSSLGAYLGQLPIWGLHVSPPSSDGWQRDWTLFYWSWWVSWSPFVGVFVARISRGRTLRDFIASVLLVPTGVTFVWLTAMGGAGIRAAEAGRDTLVEAARSEPATALHELLAHLPGSTITMAAATVLIVVFFISSSDSGSLVDDIVTSGGHPNPPRIQRVFWAVSEGAVAATLLAAGGLRALRTASLQAGLPMMLVLLAATWALLRALREEMTERPPHTPR